MFELRSFSQPVFRRLNAGGTPSRARTHIRDASSADAFQQSLEWSPNRCLIVICRVIFDGILFKVLGKSHPIFIS